MSTAPTVSASTTLNSCLSLSIPDSNVVNMEDQEKEKKACVQKLDYNAPLLSTRRPSCLRLSWSRQCLARDTKDRVPFSWEQTPGKPKDLEANDSRGMDVPPPKLPPGRQQPMKQTLEPCHVDEDGCNGDDDDNGDDDVFSDAIDVFSLSESIDVPEVEACGGGGHQSSFMIQRFLTDANELAAASSAALAISKKLNKNPTRERNNNYGHGSVPIPKAVDQSYTSPQGCGVDIFLPWWLKLKPCGLKRPVRQASLSVKPQWDATRKKKG